MQSETPKMVSIRASADAIREAEKIYGAKVTGFQEAVEGYFEIYRRTLEELKGRFSRDELCAVADNMNGVMLTKQFQANPKMLWVHLLDGDQYEGLFAKWGVDREAFGEKILALTAAQCYILQEAAYLFWYSGDKTALRELDDFVNKFTQ